MTECWEKCDCGCVFWGLREVVPLWGGRLFALEETAPMKYSRVNFKNAAELSLPVLLPLRNLFRDEMKVYTGNEFCSLNSPF